MDQMTHARQLAALAATTASHTCGATATTDLGLPGFWNDRAALCLDADGEPMVVWLAYQKGSDHVCFSRGSRGDAELPRIISNGLGLRWTPTLACSPDGEPWAFWSERQDGQWQIVGCNITAGGPALVTRLSNEQGNCICPRATADDRAMHLVWEHLAENGPEIWHRSFTQGIWSSPHCVCRGSDPSPAADGAGGVWMAVQVVVEARYEIHAFHHELSRWSEPQIVAAGQGHFRKPALAVSPGGDVWVTCEGLVPTDSANPQDQDYRLDRMYSVLPLCESTFHATTRGWQPAPTDPLRRKGLLPTVVCDEQCTWLAYHRRHKSKKFYTLAAAIDHGQWSSDLDYSTSVGYGRKLPIAAAAARGRICLAIASDDRQEVDDPAWTYLDGNSRISIQTATPPPSVTAQAAAPTVSRPLPPNDPDHAPGPMAPITVGGQTLQLFFGDLHKHSEMSLCGVFNGSIDENYAYTRDVRQLDFMQSVDHAEHQNEHDWHETRKCASIFNRHGTFVAFSGFEWTSEFQMLDNLHEGHYNATFLTDHDHLPCPSASHIDSNTPHKLWRILRASLRKGDQVLTIGHHPARSLAPLSWDYYDPDINPLIEIAQRRGSFEYWRCPDATLTGLDTSRIRGHMVQDGLARGYKLGILASGDHAGRALAAVYASSLTRDDLFHALKTRRCYGTNGAKIALDFRLDDHFMGELVESTTTTHTIRVRAAGRTLERIDVWKDGRIIHTLLAHGREQIALTHVDTSEPDRQESYYYVRVIQQDMGMAWSSPVWVRHAQIAPCVCLYVDGKEPEIAKPASVVRIPVVIRNERSDAVVATVTVECPEGWQCREAACDVTVAPCGWAQTIIALAAPAAAYEGCRTAFVSMTCDGTRRQSAIPLSVVS